MAPRTPSALVAVFLLADAAAAQGGAFSLPDATPAVSAKTASYDLRVALLDNRATPVGELDATWRNPPDAPTAELPWPVSNNARRGRGPALPPGQRAA
nr:hypothetical protein [Planctomycetota bacterium]